MVHKFLILFLSLTLVNQTGEDNLIEWSPSRKLTWSDFQGTPDPLSTNAALTNSTINLEFGYNNKGVTHSIRCRFNKKLSWGRIRNDYILNHEQRHFDIAEAHARLLHKNIGDYVFDVKNVDKVINKIYNETIDQHVTMQKQYDEATNHSLDTAMQQVWDKKVSKMLSDLEEFSDYK